MSDGGGRSTQVCPQHPIPPCPIPSPCPIPGLFGARHMVQSFCRESKTCSSLFMSGAKHFSLQLTLGMTSKHNLFTRRLQDITSTCAMCYCNCKQDSRMCCERSWNITETIPVRESSDTEISLGCLVSGSLVNQFSLHFNIFSQYILCHNDCKMLKLNISSKTIIF